MTNHQTAWWYWVASDVLLAAGLASWTICFYLVIALCCVQIIHFAIRDASLTSFSVQIRVTYLGMSLLALMLPFHFIFWFQLIGTSIMVLFNYCLLARSLSLLPWNRSEPLSFSLIGRTFFSRPVFGSILETSMPSSLNLESRC